MSDDRRIKVTVEGLNQGTVPSCRVFVAEGDTVTYSRDVATVEVPPANWGLKGWPKKRVTTHTLTWKSVTYE